MHEKKLNELFVLPTGLKPEIELEGTKFYSSPKLKTSFSLAFQKSSKGAFVAREIQNLVSSNIIIPCYRSKNILGFVRRKVFYNSDKYFVAFYDRTRKIIIIVIDNNTSLFGTAANNDIVTTTLHECMHLAAGRNLNQFRRIFNNSLTEYYSSFLKNYFKLEEIDKSSIKSYIDFIQSLEQLDNSVVNRRLVEYYNLIESLFKSKSSLGNNFDTFLQNYIVACKLMISSPQTFISNISNFMVLISNLKRSYNDVFKINNNVTTPIQELFSISEVACVYAELKHNDPIIRRLFRII